MRVGLRGRMAEKWPKGAPERERLLSQWTDSSNRLTRILDEQLAAIRNADPGFANLADEIRMAKNAEIEACRAYYDHVEGHCV
jgi:hypothetical protein